ncbi:voltage-gated potassium channel [Parathielavia appendiculata]|uniref:Voltage-gated potassium channel n=1 Tax=Parathielavia appendiculata TaxID=2587402 RepID=A0AAN6UBJ8_9PEZI|nr:voltage-gated potassium channel [Parathielavia appendiculata]
MIAGTLGPVASAFSICALVTPWRQSFPPGTDVDAAPFIRDPPWLTAINAVQLFIAIVANMALLLNMTRRLSFTIAQPVTIIGWYISSFTLIALTATGAGPLVVEPADEFIWSQAFYYGVYAAVVYFLVASLMVVTYKGAYLGRYPKDFMLTPSQRTLMLQTIMLLLYLLVGALIFCKIEGWAYLDAVYWAAVTLFTVGFGDFYATTTLGRALLLPYALVGIISLGLVIGSIRSLVLDRGKTRLGARMVEKKRRRTLRRMTRLGKDDILVPITDDPHTLSSVRTDASGLTEFERREREFELMRKIQEVAHRRRRWVAMGISTGTTLVLWLVGAKVFQECEVRYQGWSYFDAFYFAFVSLTTIGYGDITPVSNAGKTFWVFWALLALPTMTVLISNAGDTIIKGIREGTDRVATVTILPSERGFKRDVKQLLRMLSFGILFDEDIEQEPTGLLGQPQRLKEAMGDSNNKRGDAEQEMQQDEADLEAEGANTAETRQKRADRERLEEGHTAAAEANAAAETATTPPSTTNTKVTFSSPSRKSKPFRTDSTAYHHHHQQQHQPPSIPRQQQQTPIPPPIPDNRHDYHVTLIDEIRRVTEHLKHHPPRKYSFHEWAWYLRLIGEDEADAERHRRAALRAKHGKAKSLEGSSRGRGTGGDDETGSEKGVNEGNDGQEGREKGRVIKEGGGDDGKGDNGDAKTPQRAYGGEAIPVREGGEEKGQAMERETETASTHSPCLYPWSWVGDRSPLMGSQEEAEWILERLIARLGEELRAAREAHHHSGGQ